ncbi:MAG: peptidylprolyl isomerase [Hyphomicrobiales bacterium]|nr:peptidylprolyl isomerase [Hyphomicrobiales bacterium]MDE2115112.1 peptidylprolyl isomerase [Hyphomicrobiales bacterium]
MSLRKSIRPLALSAGLALLLPLASITASSAAVLATVNGTDITDADVAAALTEMGGSLPAQLQGKARDSYALDYLIDLQLVVEKAKADKLDQSPKFLEQMALLKQKALMEAELSTVAKAALTPDAVQKTYEEAKAKQKPVEEYHARHILVPTEAEANAVEARLKKGDDFVKVAEEVSKDPGSPGGDLGWFTPEKMVPEFSAEVEKMKVGDISPPIKSKFGWHVIDLLGKRDKAFPSLDAVKPQVTNYVLQKAQTEFILGLRKAAKITRAVPAVDPAAPAADAAPAAAEAPKK